MLVDLHCHTAEKSEDSSLPLEQVCRLARKYGIDAVCITDHDAFWAPDVLAAAGEKAGVTLLPGAEINTDAGHVLVFGLEEYRFGYHHPDRLADAVAAAAGAAVLAHPYRRNLPPGAQFVSGAGSGDDAFAGAVERAVSGSTLAPLLSTVDAVEVLNGRGSKLQNRFSTRLAELAGLPGAASSDAHAAADAGVCATEFENPVRGVADLIGELKAGRFRPVRLER